MGQNNLNPEFQRVLRGYKTDEVDEFIAQISTAYEQIRRESLAAKEEVDKLKKQLEYFQALESSLNKALVSAQQKADEIVNTAQDEVNRSLTESRERLENINTEIAQVLAGAAEKSRQIEAEAQHRAEEILFGVREQVSGETSKQLEVIEKVGQIKQAVIAALRNSLAELEGTGENQVSVHEEMGSQEQAEAQAEEREEGRKEVQREGMDLESKSQAEE